MKYFPPHLLLAALLALAAPALHAADGSLSFDRLDDFVEVPAFQNLGITSDVTVEFWALTNATRTKGGHPQRCLV